jgi:hypothetical protein
MAATFARLNEDAKRLSSDPNPSNSRKKTLRDTRRHISRVEALLKENRVEEDVKGLKMTRVFSRASTKQAMVARVRSDSSWLIETKLMLVPRRHYLWYCTSIAHFHMALTHRRTTLA